MNEIYFIILSIGTVVIIGNLSFNLYHAYKMRYAKSLTEFRKHQIKLVAWNVSQLVASMILLLPFIILYDMFKKLWRKIK